MSKIYDIFVMMPFIV